MLPSGALPAKHSLLPPAPSAAILALIDDLAALAAELYFAGRLCGDNEESRPE